MQNNQQEFKKMTDGLNSIFIICFVLSLAVNIFGLENPSFESEKPLYGWQPVIFKQSQTPSITADTYNHKDGKQSLKIVSNDPADIAIVQEVNLPPNSLWRTTCWIKTENLEAVDSTLIGGTLHIRTMDNLPIVEVPGQFGTSSWRKVEALFRVPACGQVQIVLFLVGFGKGTGKVWFDDVHLEKIADAPAFVPVRGPRAPKVELLDEVMLKYREEIGCTAATLAISKDGKVLYRRGYGWRDRVKTIPTNPDTMIGIASCDKPLAAAAIRRLAQKWPHHEEEKLFDILPIKPQGEVVDPRIRNITIGCLIGHTAGWGSNPRSWATELAHQAGFKDSVPMDILLGFVMTRPLENIPGSTPKYCNFGYDILRYIVEKQTEKTFTEYVCNNLLDLSSTKCMYDAYLTPEKENTSLIWNYYLNAGEVSASARVLCRFMERYWLTGEPRQGGNPYWVMYGSLDSSTAMMVWRSDGINLVALFNGRRSNVGHDEIKGELEKVIEQLK